MKKVLTLILFLKCQLLFGQNPYYYVIDKSKGLPSNSVYDIFQDKKGYMWFATDEGISRYNGSSFKTFYGDEQTSKAGSCINEDNYGRIWYSNFDGYLYYVQKGNLKAFNNADPLGYFKFSIINNNLYYVNKKGLAVADIKTLKQKTQINLGNVQIFATAAFDGKFYVLADFLYEIAEGKLSQTLKLPIDFYKHLGRAVSINCAKNGITFFSKSLKTSYIFKKSGVFQKQEAPNCLGFVQNVASVNDQLWLATSKGIYRNVEKEAYLPYFTDFNISSVFKDDRGNHWFSTLNKGLLLVPDLQNVLLEVQSRPIRINAIKEGVIASTENETLYRFDLNSFTKKKLYNGDDNHSINQLYNDSLGNKLMFTSSKFIILGNHQSSTKNAQVAVKDVVKIDDTYFSFAASGYSGIFKPFQNTNTSIWDSLFTAEVKLNPTNFNEIGLFRGLNGKSTTYNKKNKTIYYATNVGLFYCKPQSRGELKYKNNSLYLKSLQSYNAKVYGLATNGKVYRIDALNHISPFDLKINGNEILVSKIKIIGSSMYLFTQTAIYEFSLRYNKIVRHLEIGQDFEVSDIAKFKNKLVFSTAKGILLQENKQVIASNWPSLVLEEVRINDSLVNKSDFESLKYWQNNIEVKYAVLAYTPNEKFTAYYKLNDNKWLPLNEKAGSLKFSSLSPGAYHLDFKLTTDKEYVQSISFVIAKPFWLSNLFFVLIAGVLFILFYAINQYKIDQNNKRNQLELAKLNLEKNLNLSKLKAVKSQMNPHFFYNALNTIQSFILDSDKKQALGYLSKFSSLTRTILEMSDKEYVSLKEEVKMMGFYLDIEKARFNGDFDYKIEMKEISEDDDIRIPSLLIQPYLENAIKHGLLHKNGEKELKVIFEKSKKLLKVAIDDNGIGRQRSMELNKIKLNKHQPFATEAIQNRVDLLNIGSRDKIVITYTDKVDKGRVLGTKVLIEIPLINDLT